MSGHSISYEWTDSKDKDGFADKSSSGNVAPAYFVQRDGIPDEQQ